MELILVLLFFIIQIYSVITILRGNYIVSYKRELNEKVFSAAKFDEWNGRPWKWRFDGLDNFSYYPMVFKFWVPLDNFFPSMDFADADINSYWGKIPTCPMCHINMLSLYMTHAQLTSQPNLDNITPCDWVYCPCCGYYREMTETTFDNTNIA